MVWYLISVYVWVISIPFFMFFFLKLQRLPPSLLFPYTTLFRSAIPHAAVWLRHGRHHRVEATRPRRHARSEEHTSELQSLRQLVFRLLLEKKNIRYLIQLLTIFYYFMYIQLLLFIISFMFSVSF